MRNFFLAPEIGWLGLVLLLAAPGGDLRGAAPNSRGAKSRETAARESSTEQETLLLFAAASTKEFVEDVLAEFAKTHPHATVKTSFAGSPTLAQQAIAGAEVDLFLSANAGWVKALDQRGLVAEECELLGNELVLVVPSGSRLEIAAPGDLLKDELHRLALAEPESVPAGIYAKQALVKLELWDRLKPRVVGAADVRQALAYVETGAAEAGIVYATDAALSGRVETAYRFDAKLSEPIVYPLALLKRGQDKPGARALYAAFQSEAAAKCARRRGFTPRVPMAAAQP